MSCYAEDLPSPIQYIKYITLSVLCGSLKNAHQGTVPHHISRTWHEHHPPTPPRHAGETWKYNLKDVNDKFKPCYLLLEKKQHLPKGQHRRATVLTRVPNGCAKHVINICMITRKTEEKLDGRYKEGHERKKPK